MKCPKCGNELEEGKLLCEKCGEEIKYVPDFDIELEAQLKESISTMMEELAEEVPESKDKEYEDFAVDEDLKDEFWDYFPKKSLKFRMNKKAAIVLAVAAVLMIGAAGLAAVIRNMENSYDYQYDKAVKCAAQNEYGAAVNHLERALAIDASQTDAGFLLAEYYDKNNMSASAVSVLNEILEQRADYPKRDEVYDMLLSIYEAQEAYGKMGEILAKCDVARIVSKYNKYAALPPRFNKEGGTYDELISITLEGNTQGFVYYTLDGAAPTLNSPVYETPILLESGDYIIHAVFVNMYGTMSRMESQSYHINLLVPKSPVISLDSGTYNEPALIEAYYSDDVKIYYTTDGGIPDKNSKRYDNPIELPYGRSNFSFIAIDGAGLGSEVVSRSYELGVESNFDTELAIQVLKNNLLISGRLLNEQGNVPDKLGHNEYRVQTVTRVGELLCYVIYEEYVDTVGRVHDTSNIYAVDVSTADLYKAYKIDEGEYHLTPFDE